MLNALLADVASNGAIETLVNVAARSHVVRDDIQQAHHLTEDENAVTVRLEARKELVQKDHLARVHDEAPKLLVDRLGAILGSIEQVRVVCSLLELHGDVHERDTLSSTLAQDGEVLGEDVLM